MLVFNTRFGQIGNNNRWPLGNQEIFVSRYKDSELYCGKPDVDKWGADDAQHNPIMEKETKAIVDLSKSVAFAGMIDVHSYDGSVGWAEPDLVNNNLRPAWKKVDPSFKSDNEVFNHLGKKAAALIINPPPKAGPYRASKGPYPTSGDILSWQYENTNRKCLAFLIEVGKANFRPTNPTAHAKSVLPGLLFLMYASVDDTFQAPPKGNFKK